MNQETTTQIATTPMAIIQENITQNMQVQEAVKVNPAIIPILSANGIDYCCGGATNLAEAIEAQNIDAPTFIASLNRMEKQERGTIEDALHMNPEELVRYIVDVHHRRELEWIDEIDRNLAKLLNVHYASHGDELADIYRRFVNLKLELIPHFAQEEHTDFPEFLATGKVDFAQLRAEHEEAGAMLDALERDTDDFTAPADACATYQYTYRLLRDLAADIHQHIFLENSVLFEM